MATVTSSFLAACAAHTWSTATRVTFNLFGAQTWTLVSSGRTISQADFALLHTGTVDAATPPRTDGSFRAADGAYWRLVAVDGNVAACEAGSPPPPPPPP